MSLTNSFLRSARFSTAAGMAVGAISFRKLDGTFAKPRLTTPARSSTREDQQGRIRTVASNLATCKYGTINTSPGNHEGSEGDLQTVSYDVGRLSEDYHSLVKPTSLGGPRYKDVRSDSGKAHPQGSNQRSTKDPVLITRRHQNYYFVIPKEKSTGSM